MSPIPGLLIWTIHAIIADDQIAHMWGSQRTLLLMASLRRGDDAAPQLLDSLGSTLHGHATRLVGTLPVPYPAQHSRRRPADGYVDPLVACAVRLHQVRPAPGASQNAGEVVTPFGDAVGHKDLEQLIDSGDGQLGPNRRDRLACTKFGIDPVDHRLVGHPPNPEADSLVRAVPG